MQIEETYINQTQGYRYGESGLYTPYTDHKGELFRSYQREFGRCTSKIYRDTAQGTITVGWVFEKRQPYSDCAQTYIQETWVTLYDAD